MLFNSWVFPAFLLLVLTPYFLLPHRAQNRLLLVASYVFYGYWDYRFLSLIFASTVADYLIGRRLDLATDSGERSRLVTLSCCLNLGLLGIFKYFGFFVSSFADAMAGMGFVWRLETLEIVLPVGISFYTFQTMSYTIDVNRRSLKPSNDFLDFALFVSFFPQLVAGPIERASNLLPQVELPRRVTLDHWIEGGWLILKGAFLKMVVADNLAITVNEAFAEETPSSGFVACAGVVAFAFQIYGDFAGYSKIARGVALLFGFRLMRNFRMPYLSRGPSEFWTRWHISLSSWLRDYLYIPLGGNRGGSLATYRNLMLTMLLGGLWHGAAWTFVLWGFYHGLLLTLYRMASRHNAPPKETGLNVWLQRAGFFVLTCGGWLLFRADSLSQVIAFLKAIVLNFAATNAD